MQDQPDDVVPPEPPSSGKAAPELKHARALTRWLGRPNTSQRQLLDLFIAALVQDFKEGGPEAIATLRRFDPVNYLRLIAVMVPRQLVDAAPRTEEYDDEIADALDRVGSVHVSGGISPSEADGRSSASSGGRRPRAR